MIMSVICPLLSMVEGLFAGPVVEDDLRRCDAGENAAMQLDLVLDLK